jgi:hypothetical protein
MFYFAFYDLTKFCNVLSITSLKSFYYPHKINALTMYNLTILQFRYGPAAHPAGCHHRQEGPNSPLLTAPIATSVPTQCCPPRQSFPLNAAHHANPIWVCPRTLATVMLPIAHWAEFCDADDGALSMRMRRQRRQRPRGGRMRRVIRSASAVAVVVVIAVPLLLHAEFPKHRACQ